MTDTSRYELLEQIGSGRYATVYRARDNQLGREVAVKQISDEFLSGTTTLDRYWQEAQLLASLQHPNIITIYDIDRDRGWLVMELMQATLADRLAGRQMDLRALRTTVAHCLRALHYLHQRGIVHGDIKPSNMMIDARRRIKIGDFGLARRVSDHDGTLLKGSTRYIAPEVVSEDFGEVETSSDLYSLGFAAYELMCGPPFEELALGLGALRGDKAGEDPWIEWHASPDRVLPQIDQVLEGVPEDLSRVIQKLTQKDKSRRYQEAEEALSDLKVDVKIIRKDTDAGDEPEAEDEDAEATSGRRRRLVAIVACCASILFSLILALMPGDEETPPKGGDTVSDVYVLVSVDSDTHTLRVRALDTGVEQDLTLADDVSVLIQLGPESREHGSLADLTFGDRLDLKSTRGETARVVELTLTHPLTDSGFVKSLDVPKSQLLLAPQTGERRDDISIRVTTGTRLLLNGERSDLLDIDPGDLVSAVHVRDAGTSGTRLAVELDVRRKTRIAGLVNKVDVEQRQLTVQLQSGASSLRDLVLTIATDARLSGLGSGALPRPRWRLPMIKPGMMVVLERDRQITSLTVVAGSEPLLRTALESVDLPKRQLSIKQADGTRAIAVGESTEVYLNSRPSRLAELRGGDTAWIVLDPDGGKTLLVAAERGSFPHRWALLVGTGRYRDESLTPLPFAGRDLKLIAANLSWYYRVPNDGRHALKLIDTPREELKQEISKFLAKVRGRAELVVYVTGHAYTGDDGVAYLAPRGFEWDKMAETGVPLKWLAEQVEECGAADKLLLLDCTHSGSGRDLQRQPDGQALLATLGSGFKTTTAIGSCSKGERGLADDSRRHGLFAWHTALGYRGDADADSDGHVSSRELFEFVRDGLRRDSERLGGTQVPVLVAPR